MKNNLEHFPLIGRLHIDILEKKYGPIQSQVLQHDQKIRIAHLIDANSISRTYAITFFNLPMAKNLVKIDKKIARGQPIGKVFRKHKYLIQKNVIDVFTIKIPSGLQRAFMTKKTRAKARLSEFLARKNSEKVIIYGTVAEIYSPDFRPALINKTDLKQINPSADSLAKIGISKEELWNRISSGNNWQDLPFYQNAKNKSEKLVSLFRKKIMKNIQKKN